MRYAEKVRKKKNLSRIPFILDSWNKITKKIAKKLRKLKKLFPVLFLAKTERDRAIKREKKILVPNSVQTRPGKENYEKNSKKIQKIKKHLSGFFYNKNGMR